MADKFIPYDKLSKKDRRKRDNEKRKAWGISPVTQIPEYSGAYNREREKERMRRDTE